MPPPRTGHATAINGSVNQTVRVVGDPSGAHLMLPRIAAGADAKARSMLARGSRKWVHPS